MGDSLKLESYMDSRFNGRPAITSKKGPDSPFPYKAPGIRAPITVDESDFEFSASSRSRRNGNIIDYYSSSEMESEGFVSGDDDDDTETGIWWAHGRGRDQKIIEKTYFLEEFALSKPTGEAFGQGNSNVSGNEFLRIRVRSTEERTDGHHSDDSVQLWSSSGDEYVENDNVILRNSSRRPLAHSVDVEFSENKPESPMWKKLQVPIARISYDTDGDSQGSKELENEAVSSFPSHENLQSLNGALKVRTWDTDEDNSNESETENMVRMDVTEDIISCKVPLGAESFILQPHLNLNNTDEGEYGDLDKHKNPMDLASGSVFQGITSPSAESGPEDTELCKAASTNDDDLESCNSGFKDNHFLDKDIKNESLETEIQQVIDQSVDMKDIPATLEAEDMVTTSAFLADEEIVTENETLLASLDGHIIGDESIETDIQSRMGSDVEMDLLDVLITESAEPSSFYDKDPFVDPDAMICSTRIIAEAMSPRRLVPPSINGGSNQALREGEIKKLGKLQQILIKYMNLVKMWEHSPEDYMASEVLHWLKIADIGCFYQASDLYSDDDASLNLEMDLEFSLSILVIGKTGVGKSATINSIFGESKTPIDAFEPATDHVIEMSEMLDGVKLNFFDTPGLRNAQSFNRKVLSSIRKVILKSKPDVILYVDRLDMPTSYLDDLLLFKSITSCLGSEIWQKTVVALTHSTSEPPEGLNGFPMSHEAFVAHRSQLIQQLIRQCSGEMNVISPPSAVPVCSVENHLSRMDGNGRSWRTHLMLLCYLIKTLSEVHSLVEIGRGPINGKLCGSEIHSSQASYLSSALQKKILMNSPSSCYQREDSGHDNELESLTKSEDKWEVYNVKLQTEVHGEQKGSFKIMRHNGDLVCGCKVQARVSVAKNSLINIYAAMTNSELSGHISLKIRHSDQLQITALAMLPITRTIFNKFVQPRQEDQST